MVNADDEAYRRVPSALSAGAESIAPSHASDCHRWRPVTPSIARTTLEAPKYTVPSGPTAGELRSVAFPAGYVHLSAPLSASMANRNALPARSS